MKTTMIPMLIIGGLMTAQTAFATAPLDVSLGLETHEETYREYEDGRRVMQQKGRLYGLNAAAQYHFNDAHSVKLEGRYAKGKIDYTGGENPSKENPEGTPYGSAHQKDVPRRAYDVRAVYGYQKPVRSNVTLIGEAGIGHRALRDLNSRIDPEDYDRKNETTYAQIGVEAKVALANGLEISPKISYNHGIRGRQYSYFGDDTITLKQHHAKGVEVELPISRTRGNQHKISYTPYYRGWRVPVSDTAYRIEKDEDGDDVIAAYSEPKNYTHEFGVKLQYTF
ncbi:Uncharacterised protein [Moraxella ovis]|uniref:Outer membrane protein beta-barrel domain-containing protein n=2 Tax=Moraxella ovis TaxID=29433 RepID=A0A378PQY8_9GAMM|nr:outer membrane beta-barrel protein [Moraxella ovis]SPX85924.1 Uncharacterised protein [Moraxella ovis]STY87359.1 Uncharacterised protein [Moraxella ovis]STZ06870.1 Uncharacterised protein [Moraxella ovis]